MKRIIKKIYMLPAAVCNYVCMKVHRVEKGNDVEIRGRLRLYGKGQLKLGNRVRINSSYRMNPIGGNTDIYEKMNERRLSIYN